MVPALVEPLHLPSVTLAAATSVGLAATARALALCQRSIAFGEALFLSDRAPPAGTPAEWRRIARLSSREGYSRFMLRELGEQIATEHVLCVQWDGYVLDPAAWDDEFLQYDYIGAPWPHFPDAMRVGNGGFSLRSSRLLEACRNLPSSHEAEDVQICRIHRHRLEQEHGIRFAPEAVARRFAFERMTPTGAEFGFHGAFNMVGRVPDGELTQVLDSLEPNLLNRREHREMLAAALRSGRFRLARVLWRRLRHPDARRH